MKLLTVTLVVFIWGVNPGRGQAPTTVPPPPFNGHETCYNTPSSGSNQGYCESTQCCEGSLYISGICEDYPGDVSTVQGASDDLSLIIINALYREVSI